MLKYYLQAVFAGVGLLGLGFAAGVAVALQHAVCR